MVTVEHVAMYRASMPSKVKGSLRILSTKLDHDGWYFWATTDDINVLIQRRAGCPCEQCDMGVFDDCARKSHDSCDGVWWNSTHQQAPHLTMLSCHHHLSPLPSPLNIP